MYAIRSYYDVFSNASAMRMEADVPLIVPEVNHEHFGMLEVQKSKRCSDGAIITNPNCSTIAAVISLKPIQDKFGIDLVNITTMQAVSGAGYDGVPSMAILDNLVPYIGGEEEKMQTEALNVITSYSIHYTKLYDNTPNKAITTATIFLTSPPVPLSTQRRGEERRAFKSRTMYFFIILII